MKPSVLILYDYFYPGYKAGGPIQSLTNLAVALRKEFEVYVITSDHDLMLKHAYTGIVTNQWNKVNLTQDSSTLDVFYTDRSLDKKSYLKVISEVMPAVIYFNNIYSYYFFRVPLFGLKTKVRNYKIIICPRGMLQKGALAVKPFKKKIYLAYLRFTGLLNNVCWHATNEEEANDIKKHFPVNEGIVIAPNIPKTPVTEVTFPVKEQGQLKLVFLSLIAEKKNLLLLLQVIKASQKNIVLGIYGPVIDKVYWHRCESLIRQMPDAVQYKGEVQPSQVQQVLSQYHALILLTKGENFGHALYESLSVGRPVITSYFTPWNELHQKKAGVNLDISDMNDCKEKLDQLAGMNQDKYNSYCTGAHELALQYYKNLHAKERYRELFG